MSRSGAPKRQIHVSPPHWTRKSAIIIAVINELGGVREGEHTPSSQAGPILVVERYDGLGEGASEATENPSQSGAPPVVAGSPEGGGRS